MNIIYISDKTTEENPFIEFGINKNLQLNYFKSRNASLKHLYINPAVHVDKETGESRDETVATIFISFDDLTKQYFAYTIEPYLKSWRAFKKSYIYFTIEVVLKPGTFRVDFHSI